MRLQQGGQEGAGHASQVVLVQSGAYRLLKNIRESWYDVVEDVGLQTEWKGCLSALRLLFLHASNYSYHMLYRGCLGETLPDQMHPCLSVGFYGQVAFNFLLPSPLLAHG